MQETHHYAKTMPNDLKFQSLEQFVVLARTRNFTRSAEELHLSQSALSRSIQKLEEQLGQPLFERKPREVILTPLGEVLLERAKAILKLLDDTYAELAEAGRRGRIRLGAIPTIAPYLLPELLGSFAHQHPDISVLVQEDTTETLVRRCHQGELDLAIVAMPIAEKMLAVEALFDEELLLVVPAGHALEFLEPLTIRAVEQYPFVMLNEAHCLAENIASFCRQNVVRPVTVERTSQLTTVQELVALDHGVSIVPEMARRLDVSDRRVYRQFSGSPPQRTVVMMWNPTRFLSPATRQLMEHLRHAAKA
jgi:LysR family transcriptional regulator, hydrogen peroxide-inducible genes activator